MTNVIEMGDENLKLIFTGGCQRCGACCIDLMKMDYMFGEDGICRYLMERNQRGERRCKIKSVLSSGNMTEILKIPEKHRWYWKKYCNHFPRPDDRAKVWVSHVLLRFRKYCKGYRVEVLKDGKRID